MSTGVGVSSCCLSGKVKEGTPVGREEVIGDLNTYVSTPENPSGDVTKAVVFLVDIFGWKLPNIRLLADSYARAGYTAYIPDVLEGDALPLSLLQDVEPPLPVRESLTLVQKTASTATVASTFGPWLIRHREAVAKPIIDKFLQTIKDRELGGKKTVVGVIGFCWGGRYAILAAQGDVVSAAVACHPSLVAVPADFDPVVKPLSLALGDKDSLMGEAQVKQIKELMAKKESTSEVKIYEDQVHGFALRGDWSSEKDREAMDKAEKQGLEWFGKYL